MKRRLFALGLAAAILAGCSASQEVQAGTEATQATEAGGSATAATVDSSELFSDRDLEGTYSESGAAYIRLAGASAQCDSNAVVIDGSTVTITDEGTYILSGELEGMIIVDADKKDKTQIVLNGVSIHSETSAAIYVRQADKVFITLAAGTENSLSSGEAYTAIDENSIDAAIFSKEDLTLNGEGSLTLSSPGGHGVVSKDSLTITGGSYDVASASHGLCGKDDVSIAGGSFILTCGKDGIHSENSDDAALGLVYISAGTFSISAEGDGISAASTLDIAGGSFDIVTGGGSVNGGSQTSDNWGGFMGHGGKGQMGGMQSSSGSSDEDSTSIKGLKAGTALTILGGEFVIDSADDGVHSNGNVTVNGGSFLISTGDDGFHADETLTVSSGVILISESYEGLEGLDIVISGGSIGLNASDDGLNAAGGTDQSGFGGNRGDQFGGMGGMGGMSVGNGSILISGGEISINASGDGIDANGTLEITGGFTTVCGPTQGDTATLDYDISAEISGGTFIGTGASAMAQTFSGGSQGVIAVSVGNVSAGTSIVLTDSAGNVVIDYAPDLNFSVVILSSPDIQKGETYTITVGSASGSFAAS